MPNASSARGSRCGCSCRQASATVMFLPMMVRLRLAVQSSSSCRFRSSRSSAWGTGTSQLRPYPPSSPFHAALLVTAGRCAVLALETPVRAECDHALGFHALPSAQDLLHRGGQVVVAQGSEHAGEIGEGVFVTFEKGLLGSVRVSPVESIARTHAAHGEELQLYRFAAQLRGRFEPVDLRLLTPLIGLRHEDFTALQPEFALALPDVAPDCWFANGKFRML